jgi:hypothetical protein
MLEECFIVDVLSGQLIDLVYSTTGILEKNMIFSVIPQPILTIVGFLEWNRNCHLTRED